MITQTQLIDTLQYFSSIIECNKGSLNIESLNDRLYIIRHRDKQYIENLLSFLLNRNGTITISSNENEEAIFTTISELKTYVEDFFNSPYIQNKLGTRKSETKDLLTKIINEKQDINYLEIFRYLNNVKEDFEQCFGSNSVKITLNYLFYDPDFGFHFAVKNESLDFKLFTVYVDFYENQTLDDVKKQVLSKMSSEKFKEKIKILQAMLSV